MNTTPELKMAINIESPVDKLLFEKKLNSFSELKYKIFNETEEEVIYELLPNVYMTNEGASEYMKSLLFLFEEFRHLEPYFEEIGEQ